MKLKRKRTKEVLLGLLAFLVLFTPITVLAQDSVELNVNVLERKPTDTMNDFDFSGLAASPEATSSGQVLGAESVREKKGNRISADLILKLYFAGLPGTWHPALLWLFTKY